MGTISVNGETYIKASILARELGYTSDYVGQLCRGGKVKAELVGRSWYVEPESLRAHKRDRYRSTTKKSQEQIKEDVQRIRKSFSTPVSQTVDPTFNSRFTYSEDTASLIPTVAEESASETNVVESDLEVKNTEKSPEINLKPAFKAEEATPIKQSRHVARLHTERSSEQTVRHTKHKRQSPPVVVVTEKGVVSNLTLPKKVGVASNRSGRSFLLSTLLLTGLLLSLGTLLLESHVTTLKGGESRYIFNPNNIDLLLDYLK